MQMEENTLKETVRNLSAEHFSTLAKILPEPIAFLNSAGEILYLNQAFKNTVFQQNGEYIGKNISEFILDSPNKFNSYLQNCSRTRQMLLGKMSFCSESGTATEYICEGAVLNPALENAPAEILIRLKTAKCVSNQFTLLTKKIEELNKELSVRQIAENESKELYIKASDANRLKDEFLSMVSLELRTPLNAMLGCTRMLRSGKIDSDLFEGILESIEVTALSQSELIENLLDVSKIVTGKLSLNTEHFELGEIIDMVVDSVNPTVENKSIELKVELSPEPIIISADPERLRQAFWNLVSNAVKFTPSKGKVSIKIEKFDEIVKFTVSDNGRGISPEFLPFVFERFLKADDEETKKYGGLGLGLSIVKYIVELHGGTVEAASEGKGKGSTFSIKLPLLAEENVSE